MQISDSKVLYRYLAGEMPVMVKGEDWWLTDSTGKCYLDLSSGPCISSLGHSNTDVQVAIENQLWKLPNAFGGFWASEAAERAGDLLAVMFAELNPGWFGRVIFQQGGGETVDLACKLAAQFHAEGKQKRYRVAAREWAFHGVGLLPFALSGKYPRYNMIKNYQEPAETDYVFRIPHTIDRPWEEALATTKERLRNAPWVGAVIVEPVGGPSVGAHVDEIGYMQGLREVCTELGILLIFDEILCGTGRCGALTASQLFGVWPDIILLGKGLTGGYQPMSAICLSQAVVERLRKGSGQVMFGTTFSHHTLGCAAVAATLDYMRQHALFDWTRDTGPEVGEAIRAVFHDHPVVHQVRGTGYLWGLELRDPVADDCFPPAHGFHALARKAIVEEGVIVYSKGQTIAGERDFLIIAPPFEITPKALADGLMGVRRGLSRAYVDYEKAHR